MEIRETYSTLLRQILEDQNINLKELHADLLNLDIDITYPSLYGYLTGKTVPAFELAKEILAKENYVIDDADLISTLKYSRKKWKEAQQGEDSVLDIHMKIKPETIDKTFMNNTAALKSALEMRAEELFTDTELVTQFTASGKRKLGAYLAYLVRKDLIENDFIEGDEE